MADGHRILPTSLGMHKLWLYILFYRHRQKQMSWENFQTEKEGCISVMTTVVRRVSGLMLPRTLELVGAQIWGVQVPRNPGQMYKTLSVCQNISR